MHDLPSTPIAPEVVEKKPRKLSRRNWAFLPLLSALTVIGILLVAEIVGRALFPEGSSVEHPCLILNDYKRGVTAVPHSVCREKIPESDWVEYRYNGCGHRAGMECGPKAADTYRIVLIGSSYCEGYSVSREQSFAALLPTLLAKHYRCKIELYNEAMHWGTASGFDLRFDDVLAAQPDMILWPVTPWDVYNGAVPVIPPYPPPSQAGGDDPRAGRLDRIQARLRSELKRDSVRLLDSKAVFMFRHFLYEDEGVYLKTASLKSEEFGPALMAVPTADWNRRLREFGKYAGDMERRAKRANVPFVVMPMPGHAQADMIASGIWPPSLNPYNFGRQLKAEVEGNGALYIDLLPRFQGIPDIHDDYYRVNQHLNAAGHKAFAAIMAKALVDSGVLMSRPANFNRPAACRAVSPKP